MHELDTGDAGSKACSARYIGDFHEDRMEGRGMIEWADGRKYEGQFQDGIRFGQGVMTFADGSVYDGNWIDGSCYVMNSYFMYEDMMNAIWYSGEEVKIGGEFNDVNSGTTSAPNIASPLRYVVQVYCWWTAEWCVSRPLWSSFDRPCSKEHKGLNVR